MSETYRSARIRNGILSNLRTIDHTASHHAAPQAAAEIMKHTAAVRRIIQPVNFTARIQTAGTAVAAKKQRPPKRRLPHITVNDRARVSVKKSHRKAVK